MVDKYNKKLAAGQTAGSGGSLLMQPAPQNIVGRASMPVNNPMSASLLSKHSEPSVPETDLC